MIVEHFNKSNNVLSWRGLKFQDDYFRSSWPCMLRHEEGVARIALNFSRWRDPALFNPRLLVTARALNFFGQELRLVLPRATADVLVSIVRGYKSGRKEAGRKWEESSYRSVRERKRERQEKWKREVGRAETWTWKFKFDDVHLFSLSEVRRLVALFHGSRWQCNSREFVDSSLSRLCTKTLVVLSYPSQQVNDTQECNYETN